MLFAWPASNGGDIIEVENDFNTIESPSVVSSDIAVEQKKIAWCESRNLQFNPDGSVKRGVVNSQDVGKWQINEHYHLEESIRLGMDIYTLAGNTAYAQHLYSSQGNTPWNWSKDCWSDPNRVWWEKDGEYWSKD